MWYDLVKPQWWQDEWSPGIVTLIGGYGKLSPYSNWIEMFSLTLYHQFYLIINSTSWTRLFLPTNNNCSLLWKNIWNTGTSTSTHLGDCSAITAGAGKRRNFPTIPYYSCHLMICSNFLPATCKHRICSLNKNPGGGGRCIFFKLLFCLKKIIG